MTEKQLSPDEANTPPVAEKTLPPPPEVVWLDKGYTPPASPLPKQQHAPAPDANIPPPPRELVWLEKGYSPPAKKTTRRKNKP